MTIENLIAGLQVFVDEGATGHCVDAQHDVIYAGVAKGKVSPEAKAKLEALGWTWHRDVDSWGAFT